MIDDYDDDTHYCLKCHTTIIGLDNYVDHRKSKCGKQLQEAEENEVQKNNLKLIPTDEPVPLKADDFFSRLELQSSAKKQSHPTTGGKTISGIWTRSKTSAFTQSGLQKEPEPSKSGKNAWIGGHQLKELGTGDNQTKLIKAVDNLSRNTTIKKYESADLDDYEESEDDSDGYDYEDDDYDDDDDAPPRSHTGGKWKPNSPVNWNRPSSSTENRDWNVPPPHFTGGKWKPYAPKSRVHQSPPPTHTKGKWKPASPSPCKDLSDIPPPTFTGSKWSSAKSLRADFQDVPPPNHTKGKWRPIMSPDKNDEEWVSNSPPLDHTKGKWKAPSPDNKEYTSPPPSYTKGKWKPTGGKDLGLLQSSMRGKCPNYSDISTDDTPPFRKSSGTVQYWCGPCNRRLASKIVYERHLKSELHYKRTLHDLEFDDQSNLNTNLTTEASKRTASKPVEYWSHTNKGNNKDTMKNAKGSTRRRTRRKIYVKCEVCRSRVNQLLMGKHLISHYHCRRGDITRPEARKMVLDNIHSIVLQSPYQCSICYFYCNTHDEFLAHWKSEEHANKSSKTAGYFTCVFCKFRGNTSEDMFQHLISEEHKEVISAFNGSVPIIIKKIKPIICETCGRNFTFNLQLRKHCEKESHPYSDTSSNTYQSKFLCSKCDTVFKSKIALTRHQRLQHKEKVFVCSICNVSFVTLMEAKLHRRTMEHRYAVQEKQKKEGTAEIQEKKCQYCEKSFDSIPFLKIHLQEKHSEHKVSCPQCGREFLLAQELTAHVKTKSCSFEKTSNANVCDQCPFSTDSASDFIYHKVLHGEPLIIYPDAEKSEPSTSTSVKRAVHHYKCPICDKLFEKSSLRCHIRLHTQERPFSCSICGATFVRKNNWMFHMKNHQKKEQNPVVAKKTTNVPELPVGDRPYLCSTCGDSFLKKSTLQQHMTRHTGKLFKCLEEGCIFSGRNRGELKIHMTSHSTDKPFACELCEYRGKNKVQLMRHIKVHDQLRKKLKCPKCDFTCSLRSHLKRHMRLHTGSKPYSCPHCAYKCNNMENLRRHVLSTNKHPGKCIYECRFCQHTQFTSNFAKDFKVHLLTDHGDMFESGTEAMTYIAGIYDSVGDLTTADIELSTEKDSQSKDDNVEEVVQIENLPETTTPSGLGPLILIPTKSKDDFLSTIILPKDEICLDNPTEAWSMVGSYDVEESGVLVPFHPDREDFFHEPF